MPHHQGRDDASPRLGPFLLRYPVAAGAAGEVWRAEHPPTGVGVAAKVLRGRADPATFLAEVRLLAPLHHPNIVRLLDAGLVDGAAAAGTGGRLAEGAPWLATEFAGGGTLARVQVPDWDSAHRVLSSLLAGLASAHAHGVVHRDVKPHNVLLASPFSELGRPPGSLAEARILLADFGIGSRLGDRRAARAGTPAYAAPEQLRGAWRDEGPWTDLYALGCLAWELVTGDVPLPSADRAEQVRRQLTELPGVFSPRMGVPEGLEDWLRTLLAKDPARRPAFAADAAASLEALGPARDAPRTPPAPSDGAITWASTGPWSVDPDASFEGEAPLPRGHAPVPAEPPEPNRRFDLRLEGAGLGLFAFREAPLTGRSAERRAAWQALRDVQDRRDARLLLLRGPEGIGTSRLAAWLASAAHELGLAEVLAARAGAPDVPGQLARAALRWEGTDPGALRRRVARFLGPDAAEAERDAVVALALGHTDGLPTAAAAALELVLRRLAGDRLALVRLDDLEASPFALELAIRLASPSIPAPVLVVGTVRDPAPTELRARLAEVPDALELGPLSTAERVALLHELGLSPELAARVDAASEGLPGRAHRIVARLVGDGALVIGPAGFTLRESASFGLDPDELWDREVRALSAALPADGLHALAVAAVLGPAFRRRDAVAAWERLGLRPAPDPLEAALSAGLLAADPEPDGWLRFRHADVRRALVADLGTSGRLRDAHAAAAEVWSTSPHVEPGLLAHHRVAAGQPLAAVEPLLAAFDRLLHSGDLRSDSLLVEAERLAAGRLPEGDVRHARLALSRAKWSRLRRDLGGALEAAERAERLALAAEAWAVVGAARRVAGSAARDLGQLARARSFVVAAIDAFDRADEGVQAANIHTSLAELAYYEDPSSPAIADHLRRALDCPDPAVAGPARVFAADVALNQGDVARAAAWLEEAAALGNQGTTGMIANSRGEVARRRGERAEAVRFFREAVRWSQAHGRETLAPLNLALVLVQEGAFDEAEAACLPARRSWERVSGATLWEGFGRAVLAAADAGRGRWAGAEAQLEWLAAYLRHHPVHDPDLVDLLDDIARRALDAGRVALARRGWAMALDQAERLRDTARADRFRAALGEP